MDSLKKQMIPGDVLRYQFAKKNIFLVNRPHILPNGMKVTIDLVLHPGAVLIVPFLTKEKIVILRQYRPALRKYLYEFPAGTLDPGEQPRKCAGRELMEEAGFHARTLKRIGLIYPIPGYSTEIIYIYKAQNLSARKKDGDIDEIIEPVVLPCQELKKLFMSGHIQDAKTIAGLAFSGII